MSRTLFVCVVAAAALPARPARADLWQDRTADTVGATEGWTHKVTLADIDGDGWVDLLFPNGGDYSSPGTPERSQVFKNRGQWQGAPPFFTDVSDSVLGTAPGLVRVIKVGDVDGDHRPDIFVAGCYQTQSRLYLGGAAGFTDAGADHLPAAAGSFGDAELGDVDGDGDLDLVLADWGPGDALGNDGGVTRLWLNDGSGHFSDATTGRMPDIRVKMSWDLELADVDDDFDLDVLVSSKLSPGSFLFVNDGGGHFADASAARLPQFTNNYEFEAMDVDGDLDLDLITINDGDGFREHLFLNDGGHYRDATAERWPDAANLEGVDDNVEAFLDVDADGDADFLIGSLSGPDRLLRNDGTGHFTLEADVLAGLDTPGTLGLAVGDLDHDGRLDVVESQGESAFPEAIAMATAGVTVDTAAPSIGPVEAFTAPAAGRAVVRARIHDRKSPSTAADWKSVSLHWRSATGEGDIPMDWYGEYLWRGALVGAGHYTYRICATDAAGNAACSVDQTVSVVEGGADAGPEPPPEPGDGGCCQTSASGGSSVALALLVVAMLARRGRRSRQSHR